MGGSRKDLSQGMESRVHSRNTLWNRFVFLCVANVRPAAKRDGKDTNAHKHATNLFTF